MPQGMHVCQKAILTRSTVESTCVKIKCFYQKYSFFDKNMGQTFLDKLRRMLQGIHVCQKVIFTRSVVESTCVKKQFFFEKYRYGNKKTGQTFIGTRTNELRATCRKESTRVKKRFLQEVKLNRVGQEGSQTHFWTTSASGEGTIRSRNR